MSYKRYRRNYRRNSTNVIKMKFQSFIDISTDVDSMKIITVSAGGKNLLLRCPAQFSAYKYYKLGNISVKLVPASTLPVDPTGLAYGVDQKVDPRDQLSPGLCRITNGEDIFEDISGLSDAQQEGIYNSMMLDQRWFKWMLQRGVKRHGSPRYWTVGQLHQDKWPGVVVNRPNVENDGDVAGTAGQITANDAEDGTVDGATFAGSSAYGLFQTGHKGVLGWMPTDNFQPVLSYDETGHPIEKHAFLASPPEVEMFKIVLPKAYKTRYYYRAYISETVYFREPIVQSPLPYRPIDVFHQPAMGTPLTPDDSQPLTVANSVTGGNYGDN